MATTAIILAAGSGTRFGGRVPKQLVELAGVPLVVRSVQAFTGHPAVDRIVVVTQPDLIDQMSALFAQHGVAAEMITGGDTRDASTRAALTLFADAPDEKLLIHDAVRCLVDHDTIQRCADALDTADATVAVANATDTMFRVDGQDRLVDIPDRSTLRRAQTPQCFRAGTLTQAFDLAMADSAFETTDDIGVVHRYLPDTGIVLVAGSSTNLKITTPEDLLIAEALLLRD